MERGKFIVFEGIDGSGKSTISKMVHQYLIDRTPHSQWTCEPTKNPTGKLLRDVLTHKISTNEQTIAALFLADRLDHILHPDYGMKQYLERGAHVVSDRYYLSSYAYHVPHVSLDWVMGANAICAEHLTPDITFYIDIPVELSLQRIANNRNTFDLFETEERINQVKENYEAAIQRLEKTERIVTINGNQEMQKVYKDILEILLTCI